MTKYLPMPRPYRSARRHIKTGDILGFRGRGFLSSVVQWRTSSPYSHVEVAVWIVDRLCTFGAVHGRGVYPVPLSRKLRDYSGSVEWWELVDMNRLKMKSYCLSPDVWGAGYSSTLQFVRNFVTGRIWDQPDRQFCSELAAKALQAGGVSLAKPAAMYTPADINRLKVFGQRWALTA